VTISFDCNATDGNWGAFALSENFTATDTSLTSDNGDWPDSLSTSGVIVLDVFMTRNAADASYATVSSITPNNMPAGTSFTGNLHKRLEVTTSQDGAFLTLERWWAAYSSQIAVGSGYPGVTIDFSAACDNAAYIGTYWNGVNLTTPFDSNGPFFTTQAGTGTPSISSISASNAKTLPLMTATCSYPGNPGTQTAGLINGTAGTLVNGNRYGGAGGTDDIAWGVEYGTESSSAFSNISAALGTSWATGYCAIVDLLVDASQSIPAIAVWPYRM
jgi:hypothetical protein